MNLEIAASFSFTFHYINDDMDTCEVSGDLPFGVFPTEKAIRKLHEHSNERVEEQTGGEYRPVTPGELASLKMLEITGQRMSVAVANEWDAPYSSIDEED